jgi:predicted nucleic acid-binding protein
MTHIIESRESFFGVVKDYETAANRFVELVPVTFTTADRFGRIAANLCAKGIPIPTNNIWIAAHTFETGADLLSYDEHFASVDGLTWIPLRVS